MDGRLFAQDPDLCREIIMASPVRRNLLKRYVESHKDGTSPAVTANPAPKRAEPGSPTRPPPAGVGVGGWMSSYGGGRRPT